MKPQTIEEMYVKFINSDLAEENLYQNTIEFAKEVQRQILKYALEQAANLSYVQEGVDLGRCIRINRQILSLEDKIKTELNL